jgi:hypothetical protein
MGSTVWDSDVKLNHLACDIIFTYNYKTKYDNHDFKEVKQIIHLN